MIYNERLYGLNSPMLETQFVATRASIRQSKIKLDRVSNCVLLASKSRQKSCNRCRQREPGLISVVVFTPK